MTNEQLAVFIQQGGNDELLPLLWDKTRKIIYKKCNQYWRFYSEKLERYGYSLDDLCQEAYSALTFAISQFKSDKEYKFTTYLSYALKHVIRSLLSGSDVLDRPSTQSLEQPLVGDQEGEQLLVGDIIADNKSSEAFEAIERLDEFKPLYEAIDSLPDDQREVIYEYYFNGLTYQQIGDRHGFTHENARQLRNKALRSLRYGRIGARLRRIYGEDYDVMRTRHKSLAAFRSSGSSEVEDYVLRRLGKF